MIPGWDQWYFETLYLNEGVKIITDDNTCDLNGEAALKVTNLSSRNFTPSSVVSTELRVGM